MTREATASKVEGTTRYEPVDGPWFVCRLAISGPSAEEAAEGRVKHDENQELLYWRTDENGDEVVLNADDQVEIDSNQEGRLIWQVSAKPLLIRKKSAMLGAGYVNVRRVGEPN